MSKIKMNEFNGAASGTIEPATLRRDFPIFERKVRGKPLVYLDSAATSQKPRQVIEKMSDFYQRYNANPHRGIDLLSEETTAEYEKAREKVARFVNAGDSRQVVFTKNCTESINLVSYSWARRRLGKGDEILCSLAEHHSNLVQEHDQEDDEA